MRTGDLDAGSMFAAVYHGPGDLRVEAYPLPEIASGEARLRVVSASICGTDLRIVSGGHRQYPPGTVRVPGHEVVGDIVRLGEGVTGLQVGQRVPVGLLRAAILVAPCGLTAGMVLH